MILTPLLRKFALTAHVTSSVGWLGAVTCFLILAASGLTHEDTQTIHAVYLAMEIIAQFVIVPLCFTSLATGLILSLGTDWGLIRHYWILIKLVITILATFGLILHLQPISYLSRVAAEGTLSSTDYQVQIQLVIVSGAALLVLLLATALSIFKPRGMTLYGWKRQKSKARE